RPWGDDRVGRRRNAATHAGCPRRPGVPVILALRAARRRPCTASAARALCAGPRARRADVRSDRDLLAGGYARPRGGAAPARLGWQGALSERASDRDALRRRIARR